MGRWDYILDGNKDLNKDYYNFLLEEFRLSSGISISRDSFKSLLFKILFGNEIHMRKLRLGDNNYSDLESLLLGDSKFLVRDLKKISLYDWLTDSKQKKKYKKYKNVSMILFRLERSLMDVMSNIMIRNGFVYISLFDGFMVKKSEVDEIEKMLNDKLGNVDKVFRLMVK